MAKRRVKSVRTSFSSLKFSYYPGCVISNVSIWPCMLLATRAPRASTSRQAASQKIPLFAVTPGWNIRSKWLRKGALPIRFAILPKSIRVGQPRPIPSGIIRDSARCAEQRLIETWSGASLPRGLEGLAACHDWPTRCANKFLRRVDGLMGSGSSQNGHNVDGVGGGVRTGVAMWG